MNAKNYDLLVKNPNGKGEIEYKSPEEIVKLIKITEVKIQKLIYKIGQEI